MRIVLDTNVLVSAVFFGGLPQTVLEGVEQGSVELVVCPEIYREYEEVCARLRLRYPCVDPAPVLEELAAQAIWVTASFMSCLLLMWKWTMSGWSRLISRIRQSGKRISNRGKSNELYGGA